MTSPSGDCFIILPELTEGNCVIYGRNSQLLGGVEEILYFPKVEEFSGSHVKVNQINFFLSINSF